MYLPTSPRRKIQTLFSRVYQTVFRSVYSLVCKPLPPLCGLGLQLNLSKVTAKKRGIVENEGRQTPKSRSVKFRPSPSLVQVIPLCSPAHIHDLLEGLGRTPR